MFTKFTKISLVCEQHQAQSTAEGDGNWGSFADISL